MSSVVRSCRYCRGRFVVQLVTTGNGHIREEQLPCRCKERRASGRCIDCGHRLEDRRAYRCQPCRKVAQRAASERWKARHPDRHAASQARQNRRQRKERKRNPEKIRARDRARRRKNRDRINQRRRERSVRDGGAKSREYHRRYKERHPERVKAQQDRSNAKRAAEKREYMHVYATKYVGPGVSPRCRQEGCDNEIPWDGRGRPRLDCFVCRPLTSRERKSVRARRLAELQPELNGTQPELRSA